ncbi:CBS domain-containing protein [uncultured Eudoraea sp.]|uniref:magnesium transporter MgtE N-terminal domain-containing protein n=1 Tax=uncultured Eudoraea sp. TaxID=1035614 RepID=UPI0026260C49|nr:CBS domain-containing protein [uncultured Eudoraea sp.]
MNPDEVILNNFIDKHPFPAARALERLKEEDVAAFLEQQPIEKSLKLLELMNTGKAANCFALLSPQLTRTLLENGNISFAESLCRQLETQFLESLLSYISPKKATAIRQKLEQKPDTVGVLMVPAIVVNKEMSVHDAIEIVKRNKENLESYLYIVDVDGSFEGGVKLKELLLADRDMVLEEIMITQIPSFLPETPIKKVINHPAWYEYRYIPVINRANILLGTLPYRMAKEITYKADKQGTKEILETGSALGELYLLGLTGLLQSFGK